MIKNNYNYYQRFGALESVAKYMTGNYKLRVIFSGNVACTNGEVINLPMLIEAEDELLEDLRAFVDHEVAHCKYTTFPVIGKCKTNFHKYFLNAMEDDRIERLLPKDFPGTRTSLHRLNDKWREQYRTEVKKRPWAVRFVVACRDIAQNITPDMDEQLELLMRPIMPEIEALRDCKTTEDIFDATSLIIERLKDVRQSLLDGMTQEEYEEMFGGDEEQGSEDIPLALPPDEWEIEGQEAKGEQNLDPHPQQSKADKGDETEEDGDSANSEEEQEGDTSGEMVDAEDSDGDSDGDSDESEDESSEGSEEGESKGGDSDESEEGESEGGQSSGDESQLGDDSETEGQGDSNESSEDGSDETDGEPTQHDPSVGNGSDDGSIDNEQSSQQIDWSDTEEEAEMIEEEVDAEDSEWNEHIMGAEDYIDRQIEEHIENTADQVVQTYHSNRNKNDKSTGVSLPFSKDYDELNNFVGQGDPHLYAQEKQKVQPFINPVVQGLERMLQVEENKRTRFDRERGSINPRALAQVVADRSFNRPFKEDMKNITNNVAVQFVLDCSGSMSGGKMQIARQAAICFAEALTALQIPFEVLGFNTGSYNEQLSQAIDQARADGQDLSRFNRLNETLKFMVFKEFESDDTSGITHARSGGANCDGESVLWASYRLEQRPEPRKVMFVLSDGHPVTGKSYDLLYKDLRRVINDLPARGIEPFGIGIADDSVSHFYPDWVVVSKIEELPQVVLSELEKMVIDSMNNI